MRPTLNIDLRPRGPYATPAALKAAALRALRERHPDVWRALERINMSNEEINAEITAVRRGRVRRAVRDRFTIRPTTDVGAAQLAADATDWICTERDRVRAADDPAPSTLRSPPSGDCDREPVTIRVVDSQGRPVSSGWR